MASNLGSKYSFEWRLTGGSGECRHSPQLPTDLAVTAQQAINGSCGFGYISDDVFSAHLMGAQSDPKCLGRESTWAA